MRNVDQETISITIKSIDRWKGTITFTVKTDQLIAVFIKNNLGEFLDTNTDDLFLVNIGKQLNSTKTFREETVEDLSELFCVTCEEHRSTRNFETTHITVSADRKVASVIEEKVTK